MALRSIDLMIGDWVRTDLAETQQVVELREVGAMLAYNDIYPYDDLEPIPLTAEILVKNGFKDISTHTLKGYDTFRLDLEQRGFDYCITVRLKHYFKLESYDDRWYTLCDMEFGCNYVHTLQHALKLCGIEKEIIL